MKKLPQGTKERRVHGSILIVLVCALPVLPLHSQDAAPVPAFSLIGDVAQKVTYNAAAWDQMPLSTWAFTTDLKPKFTYGPVGFLADTTWTIPLSASLTAAPPTLAVAEAYFRVTPVEGLDLTFGQKHYSIGVGQTFTVGDSINPVIGFFDQKTGFRGATAEWSPVSWASGSAAVSTEGGSADKLTGAGQLSLLLDRLQVEVSLVGRKDTTFNHALGASYDLFGVIWTAEAAAEFLPQGRRPSGSPATWSAPPAWASPAVSASGGARWTVTVFDIDWTVAGEYLHWAQGLTADETTTWKAALASSSPIAALAVPAAKQATRGIRGQENGFFRFTAVSGTEYTFTSFAAVDLLDRSVLGQAAIVWAPWDNFELNLTLQAAGGDAGSSWEFLNSAKDRYQASFATTYHF